MPPLPSHGRIMRWPILILPAAADFTSATSQGKRLGTTFLADPSDVAPEALPGWSYAANQANQRGYRSLSSRTFVGVGVLASSLLRLTYDLSTA
jgi:hypothetical protein